MRRGRLRVEFLRRPKSVSPQQVNPSLCAATLSEGFRLSEAESDCDYEALTASSPPFPLPLATHQHRPTYEPERHNSSIGESLLRCMAIHEQIEFGLQIFASWFYWFTTLMPPPDPDGAELRILHQRFILVDRDMSSDRSNGFCQRYVPFLIVRVLVSSYCRLDH